MAVVFKFSCFSYWSITLYLAFTIRPTGKFKAFYSIKNNCTNDIDSVLIAIDFAWSNQQQEQCFINENVKKTNKDLCLRSIPFVWVAVRNRVPGNVQADETAKGVTTDNGITEMIVQRHY